MNGSPSAPTDEDLMLAFQRGSVEAFEELFRRYEQPIWGYFRRRLPEASRAEELAQETFFAVVRGADRYAPTATFRTYLYRIALNLLSANRRDARVAAASQVRPSPPASPTIDDDLWMRQAIGRLDDLDRSVLMLREFDALSYREIADVLGVPLNTVRSRLFRAREALRRLLAPDSAIVQGRES